MSRLPTVGGDAGNWGAVLNDYLSQSHTTDGKLRLDIATIAALKALDVSTLPNKMQVMVGGYYAHGDGGGGQFYYDQAASDTDNGGTIIAPTAGSGRWKRIFSETIDIRWFGAKGDGITDDTTAWQNSIACAMNSGRTLVLVPLQTYLVRNTAGVIDASAVSIDPCDSLTIIGNGATVRLASSVIVNSVSDFDQHVPILDLRGPANLFIHNVTFDQNRAGQTYPATVSSVKPGTGANPFRDNAAVRVTARSSTASAGRLTFEGCIFKNAYISGIAVIEPEHVTINDCRFLDCTWNGISFSSARFISVQDSYFYKCGTYHGVYEPKDFIRTSDSVPTGDRAGVQGRCRANNLTAVGQGYPILDDLKPNGTVRITNNRFISCAVEGIYTRATLDLKVIGNYVEDVGEDVPTDFAFNPTAIWSEWTMNGTIARNTCVMTKSRTLQPDAFRPTAMEGTGDATGAQIDDPVPLEGNGFISLEDNIITVDRGFPAVTEAQWWRYGYYPNSNQKISGGRVSHCSGPAVYCINRGVWLGDRVHDISVSDLKVEYCKRVAEVTQYSGGVAPTGDVSVSFSNILFARMYDTGTGSDDQCLFVLPSTFISANVGVSLTINGLYGDCTNTAGGSNAFRVGLFRGHNTSRFKFSDHDISNFNTGYRIYNFELASFKDITAKAGAELIEHLANLGAQNSGTLILDGIDTLNLTSSPLKLTPSTYTLDRLILQRFRAVSSTNVGVIAGLNPTYHLVVIAEKDVNAFGSHSLPANLSRSIAVDVGDANVTINVSSPRIQRLSTPLSQARTVTIPTAGMKNGDQWLFIRSSAATGAYAWNIGSGPTISLNPGEAGLLIRDTSSWVGYKWGLS